MRVLVGALIIVVLTMFALSGCGKKGPPTLREIKAEVVYERAN